jgi:hypothetical protein
MAGFFEFGPAGAGRSQLRTGSAEEQVTRAHPPHASQRFQPLPTPSGPFPFRVALDSIVGADSAAADAVSFHVIGDSGGVKFPVAQQLVADYMQRDAQLGEGAASFCYHVGDVVYYNGQRDQYYPQFYEPYARYGLPIVAIPGNHDGDAVDAATEPSLSAFSEYFCSPAPQVLPASADAPRTTMTQPNVYWTLRAQLFTIVGLYSNVPEGGQIDATQVAWLIGELTDAPDDRALLVALHHPPYSADAHHGGSARMGALLDEAFARAERSPDLVLTAHVHNYQRFTRALEGRQLPYLVAGAGGYWHLHNMAKAADGSKLQTPWAVPDSDVTLEAYADDRHGFLRLTVTKDALAGEYTTVPRPQESWSNGPVDVVDSFVVDLASHTVATGSNRA